MIKGRIVKDGYDLSVELLQDEELWGEISVSGEEDRRLTLSIDPAADIDFNFDYDEFSKVLGKAAERLWKMHLEQPDRPDGPDGPDGPDEEEAEDEDDAYAFEQPEEEGTDEAEAGGSEAGEDGAEEAARSENAKNNN